MKIDVRPAMEVREFIGRCTARNGAHALFFVTHQRTANGDFEPIPEPRKIFPKKGEVELPGIAALKINPGDERLFEVRPNNYFRAPTQNMMMHPRQFASFLHWDHVPNIAAARRIVLQNPEFRGLARRILGDTAGQRRRYAFRPGRNG